MEKSSVNNEFIELLQTNWQLIQDKVCSASAGKEVRVLAATKTVSADRINYAIDHLGLSLIGENRVQELLSKYDDLHKENLEIHFIGRLQTNKVKYIINEVTLIQSVDSLKLAQEINRLALKNNKVMDILVEINIGGESTKSGIDKLQAIDLVENISQLENVKIKGLMTIPPPMCSENVFDEMHGIFLDLKDRKISNVNMDILSMGMSSDYEVAIEEGSTMVRIGTGIFGERIYP